ncbi:MAG: ABC transporter ATP-binding protein [Vulcanimicrobiota bacterium]
MTPVLEISQLERTYRNGQIEVKALRGVSFTVERGDFVAVMGPSGSGKSTMMNILGCLDRPTAGSYKLDGVETARLDTDERARLRNQKIGFVFQGFNLLARTTAVENVELPLLYQGLYDPEARRARCRSALTRVKLGHRFDHVPSHLSGGEQQRVAIARALVTEPSLLLADEPTGNLDTRTSDEVMELFGELNAHGLTIVMVTHEQDVADKARRIITFRDGRLVA